MVVLFIVIIIVVPPFNFTSIGELLMYVTGPMLEYLPDADGVVDVIVTMCLPVTWMVTGAFVPLCSYLRMIIFFDFFDLCEVVLASIEIYVINLR